MSRRMIYAVAALAASLFLSSLILIGRNEALSQRFLLLGFVTVAILVVVEEKKT